MEREIELILKNMEIRRAMIFNTPEEDLINISQLSAELAILTKVFKEISQSLNY